MTKPEISTDVEAIDHLTRATALLASITGWVAKGEHKEEALHLLDTISQHVYAAKETLGR